MVHIDCQGAQAEGHNGHHDGALFDVLVDGVADPEQEGIEHGADDGAQGDVLGQNQDRRKDHQQDHDNPPVDEGRQGAAGEDALAAPEAEPDGENVADDGEAPAEHGALVKPNGIIGAHDGPADEAGGHRLAHVDQQHQQGVGAAVVAVEVGQTGVAAALGADILLAEPAGNQDGAVEAAQQIADHRAHREPEYDHSSSSPLCRMVIFTGVPSRPKTARI